MLGGYRASVSEAGDAVCDDVLCKLADVNAGWRLWSACIDEAYGTVCAGSGYVLLCEKQQAAGIGGFELWLLVFTCWTGWRVYLLSWFKMQFTA